MDQFWLEETSRQQSSHAVVWLLLMAFSQIYNGKRVQGEAKEVSKQTKTKPVTKLRRHDLEYSCIVKRAVHVGGTSSLVQGKVS